MLTKIRRIFMGRKKEVKEEVVEVKKVEKPVEVVEEPTVVQEWVVKHLDVDPNDVRLTHKVNKLPSLDD
jgi:hypothetical protein